MAVVTAALEAEPIWQVRSYWVLDPDVPSVTAWELRDGTYAVAGSASGDETLVLELPFPVTLVPSELTARVQKRD